MTPCLPRHKGSRVCPPISRTPGYSRSCCHIISTAAITASPQGMVWCRHCQTYVSVGGLLVTIEAIAHRSRHNVVCSLRRRGVAVITSTLREVVL